MHNLPDKLPYARTLELIAAAQGGSVAARNAAITGNLRLVAAVAESVARAAGRPDLVDDLIMAGAMGVASGDGLLHAVMHFDATRNVRFATYAHPFVREAVTKQLATLGRELGTYKVREKRTLIRNKARKLSVSLGRTPTAAEVYGALSASFRRNCSLATVELALAPPGRETHEEQGHGSEADTADALDTAAQLAELRATAQQQLTEAQRDLLNRRYNGERLRGDERLQADEAEQTLRDALRPG